MNIKLPHMPYKFDAPDGRMEITVRGDAFPLAGETGLQFAAGASFLQSGPLALKRVPLSARGSTYSSVRQILLEGFKVNPGSHAADSIEFRVLTALTTAAGVVNLDN